MHWALRMMWPVLSRQDSLDLTVFYSWLVSNCLLGIQRSLLCLRIWQSIRSGMRRLGTKLEMWAQNVRKHLLLGLCRHRVSTCEWVPLIPCTSLVPPKPHSAPRMQHTCTLPRIYHTLDPPAAFVCRVSASTVTEVSSARSGGMQKPTLLTFS